MVQKLKNWGLTEDHWQGVRAVVPLAVAIGALGVVFGFLARSAGLSAGAAVAMSAITFAGSPQFAAISVFAAGGTLISAVAAASALSSRFAAMSATASPSLGDAPLRRFLMAQLVVDETWAVAYGGRDGFNRDRLLGAGVTLYVVHVSSTALGAGLGNFIGSAESLGLDVMSSALFVVLMRPHLTSGAAWLTVCVSAAVTIAAIPFVPPGIPILVAIAVVLVLAPLGGARPESTNHRRARG
jgi:predicted branched-subunit amino acid permease